MFLKNLKKNQEYNQLTVYHYNQIQLDQGLQHENVLQIEAIHIAIFQMKHLNREQVQVFF